MPLPIANSLPCQDGRNNVIQKEAEFQMLCQCFIDENKG